MHKFHLKILTKIKTQFQGLHRAVQNPTALRVCQTCNFPQIPAQLAINYSKNFSSTSAKSAACFLLSVLFAQHAFLV